jgi:hypothetical protein
MAKKSPQIQKTQETNQEQIQEVSLIQDEPKNSVNKALYDKYTSLKFIQLSGAKLKDEALKEIKELENELKKCDGYKAKKTVRAAIANEQVLLVEGMPIPDEYFDIIVKSINPDYYIVNE